MKTIVVAVDFSACTDALIEAAMHSAQKTDKIYVIHIAAPEPDFVGYSVGPQSVRDARAQQLLQEHTKLAEYKTALEKAGYDAEALLIPGPTVETLLKQIEKVEASLLIIGRKGHRPLYEVIIGSVCKAVLNAINIPTLVIPEVTSS
jgi:nucleotide-binding universal stress UspA family protein